MHYDEALPRFAALLARVVGHERVLDQCFLRDASGQITLIIQAPLAEADLAALRAGARELVPWVNPEAAVAAAEDIFDNQFQDPSAGLLERIDCADFQGFVRLVERRIVGQDWLRPPREPVSGLPPVVVFASHKGGVGRSTALAVSAAALSARGLNVLIVDLDLEAPGLGDMMLESLPRFGTLDFYIESGVRELDDAFYDDVIGSSSLARQGLLHVAPAVGRLSAGSPHNVLGKIALAYLERTKDDGTIETFLDRTRELVSRLAGRLRYDAIFIDARAGLNEATAGAILGLGAEILLFGVDTPQTFAGYIYFLSHLQRFRPTSSGDSDWRYRLHMVQAKASADPRSLANFRTRAYEIFADTLYDEEDGIEEEAFNFDYEDTTAPHYAWPILNDANFAEFNPLAKRDEFSEAMYDRTFGPFIQALEDKLGLPK